MTSPTEAPAKNGGAPTATNASDAGADLAPNGSATSDGALASNGSAASPASNGLGTSNGALAPAERPLYTLSYDLSAQLVEEAASTLAGARYRNPASLVGGVFLVAILAVALVPGGRQMTALLVALFVGAVAFLQLGDRWQAVQLRRLRKAGLDTAFLDKDARRVRVSVYPDRVVLGEKGATGGGSAAGASASAGSGSAAGGASSAGTGNASSSTVTATTGTHPISSLRRVSKGSELLVLSFSGPAFVIVPQRAMSVSRFEELAAFVGGKTGKAR